MRDIIPSRRLAVSLLALASLLLAGTTLSADGQLIVLPRNANGTSGSYMTAAAHAGRHTVAGWLELRNPSRRPQEVMLQPVDGWTLNTLGSGYAPPRYAPHGPTLWLTLRRHNLVLAPGSKVDVPIVLAIPRGTHGGEYLSGISVAALPANERITSGKGISVDSQVRYVIGVLTRIPGGLERRIELRSARVEMQPSGAVFFVKAHNPGNAVLRGVRGWITITHADRRVASVRISPGTFVSHTHIYYPVRVPGERPAPGTVYSVRASLTYPGGRTSLNTRVTFEPVRHARAFALTAAVH